MIKIMKQNNILYMMAVACMVLAGCNKGQVAPETGSLNMTVKAGIGDLTKVTYNGVKTTFTEGDQLSLYAWIGSNAEVAQKLAVDGVVNTFDGTVWTPQTQMLWKNARDNHYFIGISPAHEVVSFTADEYVLNPAQYEANDLLLANDLTGQKVTKDLEPNPVSLTFSHALAKLNVHLKFRSQWAATPTVTSVATTAKDCYKVNYLTKEITAYGDVAQVKLQPLTTTPQTYALSFSGLQVPQNEVTVITVVIDGVDYVYTAAQPIDLKSGKITNLGLIVGREEITLDSVSVEDWVEGTTYPEDGEAMVPDKQLLSKSISGVKFFFHEGDSWAGILSIQENQAIVEQYNIRNELGFIMILISGDDYTIFDDSTGKPVFPNDIIDPDGDYYIGALLI